jgi:hypothetical protein
MVSPFGPYVTLDGAPSTPAQQLFNVSTRQNAPMRSPSSIASDDGGSVSAVGGLLRPRTRFRPALSAVATAALVWYRPSSARALRRK